MSEYRQLFYNAVAKLGASNAATIMQKFDALAESHGEGEAINRMHAAFVAMNQDAKSGKLSSLLTPAAKSIFDALDGKTISVESSLTRLKKLQEKIKAREGKELDVEINGKPRLGIFETHEIYKENGILERHKVYKSASASADTGKSSGLVLEIRY